MKDRRSAIWGGGTIGLITGLVLAIVNGDLTLIIKIAIIGVIVGMIAETLGWLSDRIRRK